MKGACYPRKKVEALWRTAIAKGWNYAEYLRQYHILLRGGTPE